MFQKEKSRGLDRQHKTSPGRKGLQTQTLKMGQSEPPRYRQVGKGTSMANPVT